MAALLAIVAALASVLGLPGGGLARTAAGASASAGCLRDFVPAYFYPPATVNAKWARATAAAPTNGTMVADWLDGPGRRRQHGSQKVIAQAQAAGVQVLGYVYTNYGTRSMAAVKRDIWGWHAWYHVNGIFFDEASWSAAYLGYYRALAAYARAAGAKVVVVNPGMVPDRRYMRIADMVVDFEGDQSTYARTRFPTWTQSYPATRFVHIVYDTPTNQLGNVLSWAQQRNAQNVYVTDGRLPTPYASLPSYWGLEQVLIKLMCGG